MHNKYPFITIEGNIGAGKSSLVKRLSAELGAISIYEQFDNNPFIAKFYENKDLYSLPFELTLMCERYAQLKQMIIPNDLFSTPIVSDYLFIKSKLYASINLKEDNWWLYQKVFDLMYQQLPEPDLVIYLHSNLERLMGNIKQRGREYEQHMDLVYLQKIEETYFHFFKQQTQWKILILDASKLDFVNNHADYAFIKSLLEKDWKYGLNYIIK